MVFRDSSQRIYVRFVDDRARRIVRGVDHDRPRAFADRAFDDVPIYAVVRWLERQVNRPAAGKPDPTVAAIYILGTVGTGLLAIPYRTLNFFAAAIKVSSSLQKQNRI